MMLRNYLIAFLCSLTMGFYAQADSSVVLSTAEQMPEFPGGMHELFMFIQQKIVYPETALKNKLSGKCYAKFVVNTDGSISDIKMIKGVKDCPECDAEAIRVISIMPKWIPGKQNGKTVAVYYILPFNFQR